MNESPTIEISETYLPSPDVYRLLVDGEEIGMYPSVIEAALAVEKLMKERKGLK